MKDRLTGYERASRIRCIRPRKRCCGGQRRRLAWRANGFGACGRPHEASHRSSPWSSGGPVQDVRTDVGLEAAGAFQIVTDDFSGIVRGQDGVAQEMAVILPGQVIPVVQH